jgi:molybdopterin-binding protein
MTQEQPCIRCGLGTMELQSQPLVELAGGSEIVSIITKESAESLVLSKDKETYAVIKASSVTIALD